MTTDSGDYDTIILGAGPAGLFCALQAAAPDRKILILEKKPACGRKLLITGSGQCNLTHGGDIREFLARYGDHGAFLRSSLLGFTNTDLTAFFESRGLDLETDENGKVFPATRKAADVLALLLRECRERGVRVRCGEPVLAVERNEEGFLVATGAGRYTALRVVIATGGASYPATGSAGDGYRLAAALGHTVTPVRPALAPVAVEDYPFAHLAGISFENVTVSLFRDGRKIREIAGDLLFTHTGLSGPAVLHLSRYTAAGDVLKISFLPGMTREGLEKDLLAKIAAHGTRQVKTILAGYGLPERFVLALLEAAGIPADRAAAHLPKKARGALIDRLTAFPFGVKAVGGFGEAMVTAGGVDIGEINTKTMASKRVPGLYVIGEVLDVDGDTGGYNLQAAFSTAFAAARAITGAKGG